MSSATISRTMVIALLGTFAVLVPLLAPLPTKGAAEPSVLRVHQTIYPDTADPQKSSFATEISLLSKNYEGLTRLDENLDVVPAAAERWAFDEAGTVLTFWLRPDLVYSDGTPLTAQRFADAARRTCDPTVAGGYQYILFDVQGCEAFAGLVVGGEEASPDPDDTAYQAAWAGVGVTALDDRTIEIRLTHPAPYFPAIAGLPVFYPVKRELIERGGEDWWQEPALQVGNGPFRVIRMEEGQLVVFAPNDRYWAGRPALDGLEYVYAANTAVAVEAYRAGDLHVVQPDPSQLAAIREDPKLRDDLLSYPAAVTGMIAFHLEAEPFDDKKVREAFAYAFDRETFCEAVWGGACVPTHSWVPEGIPGAIETDAYAFNPGRARRALAESSYGGAEGLPEIAYVYVGDDPAETGRAEWIAGHYRDVLGVELSLEPREGTTWVSLVNDPANTFPQMTPVGWSNDYPDPQNWLSVVWNCGAVRAETVGYCNEAFDELTRKGDRGIDMAERIPFYEAAGRLLLDDVPGVFVLNEANTFLVRPEVSGYATTPIDIAWPGEWVSATTIIVAPDATGWRP